MHAHEHRHGHNHLADASPRGIPPAFEPADARIPLLAVLLAIAAIASERSGSLLPFLFYLPMSSLLSLLAEGSLVAPWRRILPVLPVIALLGAGFPLSRWLDEWMGANPNAQVAKDAAWLAGFSLFLRALCALLLVSTLVQSMGFTALLRALRRVGLPAAVVLTLQQMERYRALLAEEWRRSQIARAARSPGALAFSFSGYANQTSLVFLRSWERSERVHAAMLARGFSLDQAFPPSASRSPFSLRHLLRWIWLPLLALLIRLTV